jgi:GPH family glycoside/pentoside/hexuronide:cation symporter
MNVKTRPRRAEEGRLPASIIATYGLPQLGAGAMFGMLLMYFMKFSTDVLLIAPGAIGLIMGLSRVWDAISDPIAGYFSDLTRSRLGRRRPWILTAAVPVGIAFFALWSPPAFLDQNWLTVWMTVWIFVFFTVYTVYVVPHKALGAELGAGYHDRTRVFATSSFLGFVGAFFAIAGVYALERSETPRLTAMTLAIMAAMPTSAAMIFAGLRLREQPSHQGRGSVKGVRAFFDVWRNPHARPLLGIHFLGDLGGASFVGLLPYVSDYILRTPGATAYYQLALLVGLVCGVPTWVPLSRRFGKKAVWTVAIAVQIPLCLIYFLLREGDATLLFTGMFLIGFINGCGPAVAASLQTDVIDADEYATGERKEGVYFASWNLLQKSAFGVNLALVGLVLQWSGFQPNVEQGEATKQAIGIAFAGLPFFSTMGMLYLLTRFRLDERMHNEIRIALLERARTA